MATLLLVLVVVLVIGGLVFGVVSLLSGDDPGLVPAEPDERARPLPNDRSLREQDLKDVRFDVVLRGYRMTQVDRMLRRTAYDLGYKDEMIAVLEAEVAALREGRWEDADLLRKARESAANPSAPAPPRSDAAGATEPAADAAEPGAAEPNAAEPNAAEPNAAGPSAAEPDAAETDGRRPDATLADANVGPHPGMVDVEVSDAGPAEIEPSDEVASRDAEPDLPREGSLRRREPVVADAVAADAVAGDAAIDVADRPAHA